MMENLIRFLNAASMSDSAGRPEAHETANISNLVQYPEEFNNSVPVITAAPLQKTTSETIIIATQSKVYPEESFKADVASTLDYFGIDRDDHTLYQEIFLKHVPEDPNVLHSADAIDKLKRVVDMMNKNTVLFRGQKEQSATAELPTGETRHSRVKEEVIITTSSVYELRIVSLGERTSNFIFDALEYLVNHWRVPNKLIQFVTNGEIEGGQYLDFWTSACVNQLVQAVQFVNLQRYLPFGYYKGKCRKLNRSGQEYIDQPTGRSALIQANTQSITN